MYFKHGIVERKMKFFKVGEEMRGDVHVINMLKKETPHKDWTFDLQYTGRML